MFPEHRVYFKKSEINSRPADAAGAESPCDGSFARGKFFRAVLAVVLWAVGGVEHMAADVAVVCLSGRLCRGAAGNTRWIAVIPRRNRIGHGPQAYPVLPGSTLKLCQVRVLVVLFEVPRQTRLE